MLRKYKKNKTFLATSIFIVATLTPLPSWAAQVFIFPETQTVVQGESVIFEIRLDTQGETVNALELHGNVLGDIYFIKKLETSGSIFSIFPEPPTFSKVDFSFLGAVPNGFSGQGIIGRIIVEGNSVLGGGISFLTSSRIFLNDGKNSMSQLTLKGGTFKIVPKDSSYIVVNSLNHQDQNLWSNERRLNINWLAASSTAYSYLISHLPTDEPDATPDTPVGDIVFSSLDDGIYYFSICTLKDGHCGTISRYRAMIDATPPDWVSVGLYRGTAETGGQPSVSFLARDKGSGISHYEISLDSVGHYTTTTSPFILPDNFKGTVSILAYDNAGNYSLKKVSVGATRSSFPTYGWLVLVLISVLYVLYIGQRKNKQIIYN